MEKNKISIPKGWRKIPISECVVEKKKSPIKVDDAANFGQYPFFTSGEAVLQHDCKLIDGENLYLATGGMANIKYFNGEAAYSTDTYVLGTKENICPKFMYYVLLFLKQYIDINYFQGSGLKHLQKKDFKRHEIIIPESMDEQQRIADALSKLDDSLSQTQSLIDKYELIKRGLMQDLLTFGIDSEGDICITFVQLHAGCQRSIFVRSRNGEFARLDGEMETVKNGQVVFLDNHTPDSHKVCGKHSTGNHKFHGVASLSSKMNVHTL